MDSISPKNTKSQYAKQLRSELLAQLQGVESYKKQTNNILFLVAATNKPWDMDSAFIRPGRFGTRVYVGLPDDEARKYMIENRLTKIGAKGVVKVSEDINVDEVAIVIGKDAPQVCPVCSHSQSYFQLKPENY